MGIDLRLKNIFFQTFLLFFHILYLADHFFNAA